jgi:hypothetical protein
MARRTLSVTISDDNRDAGKTFVITEVSAVQAEEWGLRALMALGTAGIVVPKELADAGLVGAAIVGYQAFMGAKWEAVSPLWKEMLPQSVQYEPSPGTRMPWNEILVEEVSTLLKLRQTILELHTGFTLAELAQRLTAATSALGSSSPSTSTSPKRSRRSSL